MKTNVVIYSLSDPETNRVQFLGVAANIAAVEFDMAQRRTGSRRFVDKSSRLEDIQCEGWLREMFKAGLSPTIKLETEASIEDADKVFKQIFKSLKALGHPLVASRAPGRPVLADAQVGSEAATVRRMKHKAVITAAKNKIGRITSNIEEYEAEVSRMKSVLLDVQEGRPVPHTIKEESKFYPHLIASNEVNIIQSRNQIEIAKQRMAEAQEKLEAIATANHHYTYKPVSPAATTTQPERFNETETN